MVSVTSAPSSVALAEQRPCRPSSPCGTRASPNGVSVTTRFITTLGPGGGASAPCSAMSSLDRGEPIVGQERVLAGHAEPPGGIDGADDIYRRGRIRRPSAPERAGRYALGAWRTGDPRRAHRGARAQREVAEPAAADRDVGVHQLRRVPAPLPAAVRRDLQPRRRRDHRPRAVQRLRQVPPACPVDCIYPDPDWTSRARRLVGNPRSARSTRTSSLSAAWPQRAVDGSRVPTSSTSRSSPGSRSPTTRSSSSPASSRAILDHAARGRRRSTPTACRPPRTRSPLVNVFRPDEVAARARPRTRCSPQAPAAEDGRFRVPRILGEEP